MSYQFLREVWWRALDEPADSAPRALISGSGLLCAKDGLWVVGDDLHYLIRVPYKGEMSEGHRIFPGNLSEDHAERKKTKPDTEALFQVSGDSHETLWVAMPSGSTSNRMKGVTVFSGSQRFFTSVDFTPLLERLLKDLPELNIEGGVAIGKELILLNRGNGKSQKNAVVKMNLAAFMAGLKGDWNIADLHIVITPAALGAWDGIPFSFTDAFTHDGVLYFSATAEDTDSTVEDGEVKGSILGYWDGAPHELSRIADHKIEGVAVEFATGGKLRVFAITDADDSKRPSVLLKCEIPLAQKASK